MKKVYYAQELKYFIPVPQLRPENIRGIHQLYTDYSSYNYDVFNLFIFVDGSLQRQRGGIGINVLFYYLMRFIGVHHSE